MSPVIWTPTELESKGSQLASEVWRCISPDSIRPLVKLVDTPEEVDLLQELLEISASPSPAQFAGYNPVISGPFKRRPGTLPESRFRGIGDAGVFHSAFDMRTALCEYSWHQAKYRSHSEGLASVKAIPMQIFSVNVKLSVVDLGDSYFSSSRSSLLAKSNYAESQRFARILRKSKVQGARHVSVRNIEGGECLAIFDILGIASKEPSFHDENWWLSFSGNTAYVQHDRLVGSGEEHSFTLQLE